MKYVLYENKRGYIEGRGCENPGRILDIYVEYSDKRAVSGFAVYNGERFTLDSFGRVRLPMAAIREGSNSILISDREKLYECESFVKLGASIIPALSSEIKDTAYLLGENEKMKRRVSALEERLKSLENSSYGHEIITTKE